MQIGFTIDWLSYTAHGEVISLPELLVPYHPFRDFYPLKPMFGYRVAMQNGAGAIIMFTPDNAGLGQHMVYGGSALNRYAAVAITWYDIIYHHEHRADVCRRIDLAFDVRNSALSIGALHDELQFNPDVARVKKFSRITSNDGGDTLYIGARQSEAMIRVYDKAAEQNLRENWKRIELELKSDKAIAASREIMQQGADCAPGLARQWISALVKFTGPVWDEIIGTDGVKLSTAKPNDKDTETWLFSQVAPAFGRFIAKSGDKDVLDRFLAVVKVFRDDYAKKKAT